jgi:diaminopimelate decarboxylase
VAISPLAPDWLGVPDDANALDPALWSANTGRADDGTLTVAGLSAPVLAARFGTPLYVVDEADVRERGAAVLATFQREFARIGTDASVYYAGKAFLCTEVARWVAEAGLRIDVCSGGELAVALAAGIDPGLLGFHGNNKSLAEIERAVSVGIGAIVIDSLQEIDRVADAAARHGRVQPVRLRVNSGVHAHTHEFLATAHEDQKFGLPLDGAADAARRIRGRDSLEFLGLHCHIGSQIFGADGFAESAARLIGVHAGLLADGPAPELNLGGGFGIAYTSADDATPIEELAASIADIVADECSRAGVPLPRVAFEPGRVIVGPSTFTLYEVGTIKDVEVPARWSLEDRAVIRDASAEAAALPASEPASEGLEEPPTAIRRYVSVDGGMSDNVRPALYGADYSVRIANRASDAEPVLVRIAGKHCESGDIVVDADYLPGDVAPGDLVAIPATGAYCWALSSNYNYLGRPPVVAVRDGEARVIVRGETEDDLLARDAGIRRAAPGRHSAGADGPDPARADAPADGEGRA